MQKLFGGLWTNILCIQYTRHLCSVLSKISKIKCDRTRVTKRNFLLCNNCTHVANPLRKSSARHARSPDPPPLLHNKTPFPLFPPSSTTQNSIPPIYLPSCFIQSSLATYDPYSLTSDTSRLLPKSTATLLPRPVELTCDLAIERQITASGVATTRSPSPTSWPST